MLPMVSVSRSVMPMTTTTPFARAARQRVSVAADGTAMAFSRKRR